MARKFDAAEHRGLTEDQRVRTNAMFDRMICMNIDWIAYQAQRTHDQGYVDQYINNFQILALNQAHNAA